MFEFLGVLFIILIIYLWLDADDLDFTIKVNDKKIIDYHKHTSDDEDTKDGE